MKEFICNLIQRMGTFFNPKHEKQVQVEKANGNTRKLQRFLLERFDFRYNLLTGVTEYRPKSVTNTPFSPIDERNMNGMIVDARLKGIASTSPEKKLVKVGLINLDEFDKISEKRQPDLKNLLQMMSVPVYRGKRLGYVTEPRLASFIATTNSRQILSDPTGSRRFLCVEVTDMISNKPIEHKQLYAQLKHEVLNGERDYLNKEEEKEVQRRNKAYYRQSPLEDIFHACYRRPKANEEGEWFTAAEMFRTMNKRNASALRGISAKQLSYRLTAMGFKPRHTDHGTYYHVVQTGTAA